MPRVKVLVAKKKLKAWQPLNKPDELFAEKEVPQDTVPKKAIKTFDELKDKRLIRPLSEENFVTTEDLIDKSNASLDFQLPPGVRAIAIRVNPETLVGGFILPGTRVDVVNTTRGGDANSSIILQDMLVLAVDTKNSRDPESQSMLGSTVTLAVTIEEATRLALAASLGDVRLLLRSHDDREKSHTRGTRLHDLSRPLVKNTDPTLSDPDAVASASTPKIPDNLPAAPTDPPVNPMVEPAPPEPKQPKQHELVIISGDLQSTHVFEQQEDGTWKKGSAVRKNVEGDEPPRPARPRATWPRPRPVPEGKMEEQPEPRQLTPSDKMREAARQAIQEALRSAAC